MGREWHIGGLCPARQRQWWLRMAELLPSSHPVYLVNPVKFLELQLLNLISIPPPRFGFLKLVHSEKKMPDLVESRGI